MSKPLVSIICLCYNHKNYVRQSILSVLGQEYDHIELIVVDDASTDGSGEVLKELRETNHFQLVLNEANLGICASFNKALAYAKGEFIINHAADDVLAVDKVAKNVQCLLEKGAGYGVCHNNVIYMDALGEKCNKKRSKPVPAEGDVFADVLARFFIVDPSYMVRKDVLDELEGYDVSLVYEDFDFWVRAARNWKFAYLDEPLTYKRDLEASSGKKQYIPGNLYTLSTAHVCQKAYTLCRGTKDCAALRQRIRYEVKWALFTRNDKAIHIYIELLRSLKAKRLLWLVKCMASLPIPWYLSTYVYGV